MDEKQKQEIQFTERTSINIRFSVHKCAQQLETLRCELSARSAQIAHSFSHSHSHTIDCRAKKWVSSKFTTFRFYDWKLALDTNSLTHAHTHTFDGEAHPRCSPSPINSPAFCLCNKICIGAAHIGLRPKRTPAREKCTAVAATGDWRTRFRKYFRKWKILFSPRRETHGGRSMQTSFFVFFSKCISIWTCSESSSFVLFVSLLRFYSLPHRACIIRIHNIQSGERGKHNFSSGKLLIYNWILKSVTCLSTRTPIPISNLRALIVSAIGFETLVITTRFNGGVAVSPSIVAFSIFDFSDFLWPNLKLIKRPLTAPQASSTFSPASDFVRVCVRARVRFIHMILA